MEKFILQLVELVDLSEKLGQQKHNSEVDLVLDKCEYQSRSVMFKMSLSKLDKKDIRAIYQQLSQRKELLESVYKKLKVTESVQNKVQQLLAIEDSDLLMQEFQLLIEKEIPMNEEQIQKMEEYFEQNQIIDDYDSMIFKAATTSSMKYFDQSVLIDYLRIDKLVVIKYDMLTKQNQQLISIWDGLIQPFQNQTIINDLLQHSKGKKQIFKYKEYYIQKFIDDESNNKIVYIGMKVNEQYLKKQLGIEEGQEFEDNRWISDLEYLYCQCLMKVVFFYCKNFIFQTYQKFFQEMYHQINAIYLKILNFRQNVLFNQINYYRKMIFDDLEQIEFENDIDLKPSQQIQKTKRFFRQIMKLELKRQLKEQVKWMISQFKLRQRIFNMLDLINCPQIIVIVDSNERIKFLFNNNEFFQKFQENGHIFDRSCKLERQMQVQEVFTRDSYQMFLRNKNKAVNSKETIRNFDIYFSKVVFGNETESLTTIQFIDKHESFSISERTKTTLNQFHSLESQIRLTIESRDQGNYLNQFLDMNTQSQLIQQQDQKQKTNIQNVKFTRNNKKSSKTINIPQNVIQESKNEEDDDDKLQNYKIRNKKDNQSYKFIQKQSQDQNKLDIINIQDNDSSKNSDTDGLSVIQSDANESQIQSEIQTQNQIQDNQDISVKSNPKFFRKRGSFQVKANLGIEQSFGIQKKKFDIEFNDLNYYKQYYYYVNRFDFDIFQIDKQKQVNVANCHFIKNQHMNFMDGYQIDINNWNNFMSRMVYRYDKRQNPFHNFSHGVTVLHGCYYLSTVKKVNELLNKLEKFSLMFAGLCHDVNHRGKTNIFEKNCQTKIALLYNDQSILENHHSYVTFKLAKENYLFNNSKNNSKFNYDKMRQMVIQMILSTDMSKHFQLVDEFIKVFPQNDDKNNHNEPTEFDEKQKQLLMNVLIHTADYTGNVQKFDISKTWSERINNEFIKQYSEEQQNNLPMTSFYKGLENLKTFSNNEIGFISYIVLPLYQVVNEFLQGQIDIAVDNIEQNKKIWQQICDLDQKSNIYQITKSSDLTKAISIVMGQSNVKVKNYTIIYYSLTWC